MKKENIDKQTKLNMNYFTKTDTLKIVGAILLVTGLLSLWLGFSFSIIGYLLGILLTPTGLILFLVGAAGRVSDENMESYITNKMAGFEIDIDNDKSYRLKLLKNVKDLSFEGYLFPEGVMLKRLKSGEIRSSSFSRTKIRILSDRLYIINREISLIYDDQVENRIFEPLYENIKSITVVRDQEKITFKKNFYLINTCRLVISTDNGEISIPCIDAVTTDEIAENLNRRVTSYLKTLSDTSNENR